MIQQTGLDYIQRAVIWCFPRPYIWISTAIYGGVLIVYMVYHTLYGFAPINTPLLLTVMLALLALDRFEVHVFDEQPSRFVSWTFLFYRLTLIELAALHLDFYYMSFLYAFVPFIAVMQLGWWAGLGVGGCTWMLYMFKLSLIHPWWTENIIYVDGVLTFHIMLAFTLTMARVILREKKSQKKMEILLEKLEQNNQQLMDYSEQVETLAIIQERSRLARDIHDTLGHYLTAISIQLEKANVLFEKRPQTSQESIQQSKILTDEALREVRHSVGVLRNTQPFVLTEALQRMVNRIQSKTQTVRLEIIGNPDDLPDPLVMSLYRAAQEGLTNVQKHADASEVVLQVIVDAKNVRLLIQDNGKGFQPDQYLEDHYGLRGLRERLHLVGGTLDIQSQIGLETQLKILIPTGTIS
jgi:signal transduction histidine kinase